MDTYMPAIEQLLQQRQREIAGAAHVHALKRIEHLMRVLHRLADLGFVVTGFAARADEPTTVYVDDPADELVDRACGGAARGGTFTRARSALWINFEGCRIQWDVVPDPLRAPDMDALNADPRN